MSNPRISVSPFHGARAIVLTLVPALLLLMPGQGSSVLFEDLCYWANEFGTFALPFEIWDDSPESATFTLEPGGRVIASYNPDGAYGGQYCELPMQHLRLEKSGETVASGGFINYQAPDGGDFRLVFWFDGFDCYGEPFHVMLSGDLNNCSITTGIQGASEGVPSEWGSIKKLFR